MKVIACTSHQLEQGFDEMPETVLAIGDFDGVHLGHQKVLKTAIHQAADSGFMPAVMIFHPHPRVVLGLGGYEYMLSPLQHRLNHFQNIGFQTAYVVNFDRDFSVWPAEEFIERGLKGLNVKHVVVGFDFTYGYKGRGNAESLKMHTSDDFNVTIVTAFELDRSKVSSTRIRNLLSDGKVGQAAYLLGRPYSVRGTVVSGDARGRLIGFPTANVLPTEKYFIPKIGVYAARLRVSKQGITQLEPWIAVMNVGYRPTFEGSKDVRIEVHVLDKSIDLYGARVEVEWIAAIRDEMKFGSIEALKEQILHDIAMARGFFYEKELNFKYL